MMMPTLFWGYMNLRKSYNSMLPGTAGTKLGQQKATEDPIKFGLIWRIIITL